MQKYDIYQEGYVATGEHGYAHYIGSAYGETFLDACKNYIAETGRGKISKDIYGREYACDWGCQWYPMLSEAQRLCG